MGGTVRSGCCRLTTLRRVEGRSEQGKALLSSAQRRPEGGSSVMWSGLPRIPSRLQCDVTVEEDEVQCSPQDCSGHGTCTRYTVLPAGLAKSTGYCACAPGYVGPACDQPCPATPNGICDGHGTCRRGALNVAECACGAAAGLGYWAGPACGACAAGSLGAACDRQYPGCGDNGVCNGQWQTDGDPLCVCEPGYYGAQCEYVCLGAAMEGRAM